MAYNPRPFDYSLRPFDATDLSVETADILDVRDNQLTNYLQTETASIKKETDDLATNLNVVAGVAAGAFSAEAIRYGSEVFTLPAVGGSEVIFFGTPFSSLYTSVTIVVTNGDRPANAGARFAVGNATNVLSRFTCYHDGGGSVGSLCRVNYVAFAY